MMMLWVLIPLSALLLSIAVWAFFWAVDHRQLENLEEAQRLALDLEPMPSSDDRPTKPSKH